MPPQGGGMEIIMPLSVESLHKRLTELMINLGYEQLNINDELIFNLGNKYVRIKCDQRFTTVELAHSLCDAEHNMYDDIDLYDYNYMADHGFTDIDEIFDEIKSDIIKYIIE